MADAIDNDTLVAAQALWQTDHATLPALIAESPKAGRLKGGQKLPYAVIESTLDKPAYRLTGGVFIDYRKLTCTVYGLKADVVKALPAVRALFNINTKLIYPSGARFIVFYPDGNGTMTEDPDTKAGDDVWKGTVSGSVWSSRVD